MVGSLQKKKKIKMAGGAINISVFFKIVSVTMAIASLSCCSFFLPQQILLVAAGNTVSVQFSRGSLEQHRLTVCCVIAGG